MVRVSVIVVTKAALAAGSGLLYQGQDAHSSRIPKNIRIM